MKTLGHIIVLIFGIIFGALAIQTIIALFGVAFATAVGHPGGMVLSIFYCWPVFWLAAAAALCIMIAKCCACWVKEHMCCPMACKKTCETKPATSITTKTIAATTTTSTTAKKPATKAASASKTTATKTAAKKAPAKKKPAAKKTAAKK